MSPRLVWNGSASVLIGLYKVHPAHHLTVTALAVAYPPAPLAGWLDERRYLLLRASPRLGRMARGVADDSSDLVISPDYISHGLRSRATDLVSAELGPRARA